MTTTTAPTHTRKPTPTAKAAASPTGAASASVHRRDRTAGRTIRRALAATNAAAALGPITRHIELYALCKGAFSLIDIIQHCLNATGPAHVVLSTWTAAAADIGFANKLFQDGRITSLRLLCDFSFPHRQPAYCAALRSTFGDDAIRLCKNHAKFVIIHNAEWNLVLRTSMNLNENKRLEHCEISDDPGMCGYLLEVVAQLFADHSAAETFSRTAAQHAQAFESLFTHTTGDTSGDTSGGDQWKDSTDVKKFIDESPYGVNITKAGVSYLK